MAFLVVLSAPSGGGKTTIARALIAQRTDVGYSVSATTRPLRSGETEGVDYHYLSGTEFHRRVEAGAFLEWARYGGHLYGTLENEVNRILATGRHVLLDIEVQGANQVRQRRGDVVSIFILPPTADVLLQRLRARKREDDAQIRERLLQAIAELSEAGSYDFVVVNDELDAAVAEVGTIIDAEAKRIMRAAGLAERIATLQQGLRRAADALAVT